MATNLYLGHSLDKSPATARDRTILLLGQGILFILSVYALLEHREAHFEVIEKGGDNLWGTVLFYFHSLLPLLIVFSALYWIVIWSGRINSGVQRTFLIRFQSPEAHYLSLFGFFISQLGTLLLSARLRTTAEFFSTFFLFFALAGLFLRRTHPPSRTLVASLAWAIMVVLARRTFSDLISILEDPIWLVSMRGLWGGILLVLGLRLLIALRSIRRDQKTSTVLNPRNVPISLINSYLILLIAIVILNQPSSNVGTPLWIALRLTVFIGIYLAGSILQSIDFSIPGEKFSLPWRMSDRVFRVGLVVVGVVYIILAIIEAPHLPERINPDGLAYFTIARNFAEGHFVIRGAWAPLLPMLIAPFIRMGLSPLTGWHIVAGASGLLWIFSAAYLAGKFGLSRLSRLMIALCVAFLSLRVVFQLITPDVLGALLLSWYFFKILDNSFIKNSVKSGIGIGLLGGTAYFARYYNLPFIISHLVFTGFFLYLQDRKSKSIFLGIGSALLVLLLVVSPWIGALSTRFGYFTISTSYGINRSVFGPESISHPCLGDFPCKIHDDVLFPGEDPPQEYYPGAKWNPFSSEELFRFQVDQIAMGISRVSHSLLSSYGGFPFVGLLALPLLSLLYWSDKGKRNLFFLTSISAMLYASGYITFGGGESRYHLPYISLLIIGFYLLLDQFSTRLEGVDNKFKLGSMSLLLLLLFALPVLSIAKVPEIIDNFQKQRSTDCVRLDAKRIADLLVAPMIGSDETINHLAYHTRIQSYGVIRPETDPAEADKLLHELSVQTFISVENSNLEIALLDRYDYERLGVMGACRVRYSILLVP